VESSVGCLNKDRNNGSMHCLFSPVWPAGQGSGVATLKVCFFFPLSLKYIVFILAHFSGNNGIKREW